MPDPHPHYQHHRKFSVNFGILCSDDIFKTAEQGKGEKFQKSGNK
jgi:sterol desaturase/sphingolipid hydroxylase (fatty acid hydroxylase superfamily)